MEQKPNVKPMQQHSIQQHHSQNQNMNHSRAREPPLWEYGSEQTLQGIKEYSSKQSTLQQEFWKGNWLSYKSRNAAFDERWAAVQQHVVLSELLIPSPSMPQPWER